MKVMKRHGRLMVGLLLVTLLLWGCSSSSKDTPSAIQTLSLENQERAGANCPAGGYKMVTGRDLNGDGELSAYEIEETVYYCDPYNETGVVNTASGAVTGLATSEKRMFFGIPFAAPPMAELRWKAPREPASWTGTLAATQRKDVCSQSGMTETWHATGSTIGSEDCLYLDVYRPNSGETDLPVYVFLHGGANRFGGAAAYDGSYLANDQNIIVVIPQYRLGPLGWLTHAALREEDPTDPESSSGNFGLLDNIKALEWVAHNIAGFGGDPGKVTVGGQSAGASNVGKLLISELAEGLFHGAVMQSFGGNIIPRQAGDALADSMLNHASLGYDPAVHGEENADISAFARSRTAAQLIAAHGTTYAGFADGHVLPGNYVKTIYHDGNTSMGAPPGYFNIVPILLGSTADEWKNFMPLYAPFYYDRPLWAKVYDLFDPNFDPDRDWTFEEIFPDQADIDLYRAIGKYSSLGWKSQAVDEMTQLMKQRGAEVYSYLFKWGGPSSATAEFAHIFGAAHSMDIPFFFGYDTDLFGYALTSSNRPGFEDLQAIMMQYLGNFIRNGDPGSVSGVEWEAWSNASMEDAPKCMVLDADQTHAVFGMDTRRMLPADVQAMAFSDPLILGLPDAGRAMALGSLASRRPEYYLNDEGHDLLRSELAFEPLAGATGDFGLHQGAGYRIELPEGWQPGDDLVMYAHGFRADPVRLTVTNPRHLRPHLIDNGYAWAASSFTANGYNIVSGVESTKALLDFFISKYGQPGRVYLAGHSMGGHVTARTITDPVLKNDYTGALPMCGVVGGGSELFSYFLDWGLLINYYADLNFELPFTPAQLFTYKASADTLNDPAFKAATMYLSGGNRPLYDRAFDTQKGIPINQSLGFLGAPISPVVGNVVNGTERVYHLDDTPDVTSPEEADLNAGIERWPLLDTGEQAMFPVSGEIDMPVLTIHTLGDLFVPFLMPQIWSQKIAAAGKSDLFSARAIRDVSHCGFTAEEERQAFDDLVAWVVNRETNPSAPPPNGDDILSPEVVRNSNFGCRFTSIARSADTDYNAVCAGP